MTFEAAASSFPSSFPSGLPTDLNEQQQIVDYLDRKCGDIFIQQIGITLILCKTSF